MAKKFLNEFDIDNLIKEKVVNCVLAHHAGHSFKCIEAEICANADCYPFIHPKGFFEKLMSRGKKDADFKETLTFLDNKLDEKWSVLSLSFCKKELKPYYLSFKKLVKDAQKEI